MATINLTTATKILMAQKLKSEMETTSPYVIGAKSSNVGSVYNSKAEFQNQVSTKLPEIDTNNIKPTWGESGNTVLIQNKIENSVGDDGNPIIVKYARNGFRDIVFFGVSGSPAKYKIHATYQVRSTELTPISLINQGVVYIQKFEVSF